MRLLSQKIVAEGNGNRAVVAKALVQMGQCYEKLGRAEARKADVPMIVSRAFDPFYQGVASNLEHLQRTLGRLGIA